MWEALVTLLFFPVCVILAWIADRRLLFYKYMGKRYRADKRHGIVVETEGDLTPNKGGMEMIVDGKFAPRGGAVVPAENSGGGVDQEGPLTNNVGAAAGAMTMGARGNLPNSNSAMVNVESSRELDESRREVRDSRRKKRDKTLQLKCLLFLKKHNCLHYFSTFTNKFNLCWPHNIQTTNQERGKNRRFLGHNNLLQDRIMLRRNFGTVTWIIK